MTRSSPRHWQFEERREFISGLRTNCIAVADAHLWVSTFSRNLRPCVKPTSNYKAAYQDSNRFITVKCNGGLNQMRTGIADMVAVARIMNATLVIPMLDKRSFWQDSSGFADIFDVLHFIKSLQQDVNIVKELPKHLESVPRARKHFSLWSGMSYYENMTHLWKDYQVIHVAKSDSRLANNDLPLDIQRLRCRTLYHALRFSPSIELLGKGLVERLRSRGGKYIALHLRYEKDMLSFTGCTYGLSNAESEELRIMRTFGMGVIGKGIKSLHSYPPLPPSPPNPRPYCPLLQPNIAVAALLPPWSPMIPQPVAATPPLPTFSS
ncbi:hypothetical protein KSS87_011224 [Heliosperma pusillum]|nr:hypothetical protein KSS87_011224 [Heliosperma pusillum]